MKSPVFLSLDALALLMFMVWSAKQVLHPVRKILAETINFALVSLAEDPGRSKNSQCITTFLNITLPEKFF